jgi:hypothetical protein
MALSDAQFSALSALTKRDRQKLFTAENAEHAELF